MEAKDTIRKLAEIADAAAFERLATAILREVKPEYASLLHPGVNPAEKTIKSPVDGIAFVPGAHPPHMITAHHTTCARDDLREKWLHDPATVKPRKGGKPTMPAGDLIKTAELVDLERTRDPSLLATLILTTNQEPPEDLVRDAHALGLARGLDIDIWSVSRLAHFLDTTASGQWLRRDFLGIEQERLSKELLAKLSRDSLAAQRPNDDDPGAWVARALDRAIVEHEEQDVLFVVAESGLGKSVACYKRLENHVASGGFGLILPHQTIATALTIEQAIEAALRQLHPQLAPDAGLEALALCSADHPLLLVVEDINKSGQAPFLAEKLAKWGTADRGRPRADGDGRNDREVWRLLCPLWPQVVASLTDDARKHVERLSIVGVAFTPAEGREAVRRRAMAKKLFISDLEADSISTALGHEPLLIALHEPGRQPQPEREIEEFINNSVARLANVGGEYAASDYRIALRVVARALLLHRALNPPWSAVLDWLDGQSDVPGMLRHLLHHREVIHLEGSAPDEHLAFRHDRVRDTLFTDALAYMVQNASLDDGLLAEPYFAEVIGATLLRDGIPVSFVDRVREANPLALFHALRLFREPNTTIHHAILGAIELWLADPKTHTSEHAHLRWEALAALSETESSKVIEIVRKFTDQTWTRRQALFRNGDVTGGIQLCLDVEPGVGAVWRDRQIEHAKMRFGANLRKLVDRLLRQSDLEPHARIGVLRLAGYLADPQLAEGIKATWNFDAGRTDHLGDYLWASAQCCGDDPDRFLGPVCDAWAALPNEAVREHSTSPRDDLAAHSVRWAFHKDVPVSAVAYFIKRAKAEDLRWPITYMLHGLDHPDAVEFVVRELAAIDKRLEGTQSVSPFSLIATDEWRRSQEDKGRPMSRASRERLLGLWQNQANDEHVRKQAFRFWAVTNGSDDLEILRAVDSADLLADQILWQRLTRKDRSASHALLGKLKGDHRGGWWRLSQEVWSDELTQALDDELELRGASVAREWNATYASDYAIHEVIMSRPTEQAEALLLKHWDHLRFSHLFVQTALYVATPRLLALVKEAVSTAPEPAKVFEHIRMYFGISTKGRAGVTRKNQIEALIPYLDWFDEFTIHGFWEVCNDRGWFDLRRNHFDSRLGTRYGGHYSEEQIFASLDDMVEKKHFTWLDTWIDGYLKTGATPEHVMGVIGEWLAARNTLDALQLAAMAIVHAGRRKDLDMLNVSIEPKFIVDARISDTQFAVKRRSLQ